MSSEPAPRRELTAVIMTAKAEEYAAASRHVTDRKEDHGDAGTVYELGVYDGATFRWKIALAEIGQGGEGAALETERAIRRYTPDVTLFVGVAGGVKDVAVGDVVAATSVHGYEYGKETTSGFLPRGEVYRSDVRLTHRARAEARRLADSPPTHQVLVAPIAAGSKVVASARTHLAAFLRRHYSQVVAVEMEGLGFLRAAVECDARALVIRGISDLLDGKARADGLGSQALAASNASHFAFCVLDHYVPPHGEPRGISSSEIPERSAHRLMTEAAAEREVQILLKMTRVVRRELIRDFDPEVKVEFERHIVDEVVKIIRQVRRKRPDDWDDQC
jgi:nucleoside phosphorylase